MTDNEQAAAAARARREELDAARREAMEELRAGLRERGVKPELIPDLIGRYGCRVRVEMGAFGQPHPEVETLDGAHITGPLGLGLLRDQLARRVRSGVDPVVELEKELRARGLPADAAAAAATRHYARFIGHEEKAFPTDYEREAFIRSSFAALRAEQVEPEAALQAERKRADAVQHRINYNI